MLTVKYLLEAVGFGLLAVAAAMVWRDLYRVYQRSVWAASASPPWRRLNRDGGPRAGWLR